MIELSKEKSQELADQIQPLISIVDFLAYQMDIEYAKAALNGMIENRNRYDSISFLTGNVSRNMATINNESSISILKKIIELVEIRKRQIENVTTAAQKDSERSEVIRSINALIGA